MNDIINLNKNPYFNLFKTHYFNEQIYHYHFVSRVLINNNSNVYEIALFSKGEINKRQHYKIDDLNEQFDSDCGEFDFVNSYDFFINYKVFIDKLNFFLSKNPDAEIIIDSIDDESGKKFFSLISNTIETSNRVISYKDYLHGKQFSLFDNLPIEKPKTLSEAEQLKLVKKYANETPFNDFLKGYLKPYDKEITIDINSIINLSKEYPRETNLENITIFYDNAQKEFANKKGVPKKTEKVTEVEKKELFFLQQIENKNFNANEKYNDNILALETLTTLLSEKRKASDKEKEFLSKYVGFGGLKEILLSPNNDEAWKPSTIKYREQVTKIIELTNKLDSLGITNTLNDIRKSILTAHYTSNYIIDGIYNAIKNIGFKNGNILEPSAGIGNFIGYMPKGMRQNSNISAIEIDRISGNISKFLYDDITVDITGLQYSNVRKNSQDLVITNAPFGNFQIYDTEFQGNKSFLLKRIHNYFFAKALDQAKEGGIIAMVTSKGVLDSKSNKEVREYINKNADFLGAVRLPNMAFQNNAGTSVVADIIFLRKNTLGIKNNINFVDTESIIVQNKEGDDVEISINSYFNKNRNLILGDIIPGGMYSEKDYTIVDNNNQYSQLNERLIEATASFKNTYIHTQTQESNRDNTEINEKLEKTKEGNLVIVNNEVFRKINNELAAPKLPAFVKLGNIIKYIHLRDSLMNLINAEYTNVSEEVITELRKNLNTNYDNSGFNKKYSGILNKEFLTIAKFDNDGYNVLALNKKDGSKADIFSKNTINPLTEFNTAESIEQAIVISLYEKAKIDIERIAELLNISVEEVERISIGKIFKDTQGNYFAKDEYLSGNVKKKLKEANNAVLGGLTEFNINVTELEKIIPKDIPALLIEARLGSRWIPVDIFNVFAKHILNDSDFKLTYSKTTDTYTNNGKSNTIEANKKFGTDRRNGGDLIIDALHITTPAIYDTVDEKRVLNKHETELAIEKYEQIRDTFVDWIYKDTERAERLAVIYNEKYNTTVKRQYDGSHLSIPGIQNINLFPHQKDGIWMLLQNGGGIVDHIVGAGKTLVMVAGTAEMKRTGVANKPVILALKSTIPQIVETYQAAYPLANILSPTEKDFQYKNRQSFLSKIATNNWDVIIMSHENYASIPHDPIFEAQIIQEELNEILIERSELSDDKKALAGLEKRIENLEARLQNLKDIPRDNIVYFEQTGIDHIMVDESQQFKNLSYMTKQRNVAGLSKPEGSKRAFNLLMGIRFLQNKFGADKGTTFLSGTPISNSMVEMYSLLKYLRPQKLKEIGIESFDQWATTFASPTTEIEYTVTGQFKNKTRFREFINVPELSILYNEIADVRNDNNLVLDKPKMVNGEYTPIFIPMSNEQADYAERIIKFAQTKDGHHIGRNLTEAQSQAYMLIATNLSAKMAIDMRLIDKNYDYDPNGKIGTLVQKSLEIYENTNDNKGTQLIFSDIGTPKNSVNIPSLLLDYIQDELSIDDESLKSIFGNYDTDNFKHRPLQEIKKRTKETLEIDDIEFDKILDLARESGSDFNIYEEVKFRLMEKGIPENEIAFIHNYKTQKQKNELFEKVNKGEIRIVLGSTQKLGTGVNVQNRVAAIHHLDVPWRPSDMDQRNGRGLRQGNWIAKNFLNNEIPIFAYATERTLDGYKYQLLQTKSKFLTQIKTGTLEERTIKEMSEDGNEAYAIFVAELSGNKSLLEKYRLDNIKNKLVRSKKNFDIQLYEASSKIEKLKFLIPSIKENLDKSTLDNEKLNQLKYQLIENDFGEVNKKMIIETIDGNVLPISEDGKEPGRIDYGKEMISIIDNKLNKNSDEYIPLLVLNQNIKISGRYLESYNEVNSLLIFKQKKLQINAPSGNNYTINYSSVPGVLLNSIQKSIEELPSIIKRQNELLETKNKDLIGYEEILKNTVFPKQIELDNVILEIKTIDKLIKNKDEIENNNDSLEIVEEPQRLYIYNSKSKDRFLAAEANYREEYVEDTVTVRSIFREHNYLDFYGKGVHVKNAEDVAFIMKALENKSIEHMYALHVDENDTTHLQFLGIGSEAGVVVNKQAILNAALTFNTQKIYLVHNHPSGSLLPSEEDIKITEKLFKAFKTLNIDLEHLIINTYKKAYTLLTPDDYKTSTNHYYYKEDNLFINQNQVDKITPFIINETEFISKPLEKIKSGQDVFRFIQNLRFSALPKNGMLIISRSMEIIANYILNDLNTIDILKKVSSTGIAKDIIFYGNQDLNTLNEEYSKIRKDLKTHEINVMDIIAMPSISNNTIDYYTSILSESSANRLNETLFEYETGNEMFKDKITIEQKEKWDKLSKYTDIKKSIKKEDNIASNSTINNINKYYKR